MKGLKHRMGKDVRGDVPIDFRILHKIIIQLETEMMNKETSLERRRWIAAAGTYFTLSFVLALRGNETLMLDLKGLKQYLEQGRTETRPHVVVPLLGRFKGEDYQRWHILLAPNTTDSGFEPRKWIEWLVQARKAESKFKGPAFCDKDGDVQSQQPFNDELAAQLLITRDEYPDLFPPDLILDEISTSRSFRKGSTSRAQDLQLNETIIDTNNRWRSFDQARGSRPSLKLRDHYSSTRLMATYPQAM